MCFEKAGGKWKLSLVIQAAAALRLLDEVGPNIGQSVLGANKKSVIVCRRRRSTLQKLLRQARRGGSGKGALQGGGHIASRVDSRCRCCRQALGEGAL
jgi:hypothetical protein